MEQQQKLLWTILSVAILVLVLLGAGMFFFLPADSTGIAKGGKAPAPVEWSKSATPAPAATPTPAPAPKPAVTPAAPVQTEKKTPVAVTKPAPAATPAPALEPKPAVTSTPATPAKTEVKKTPAESYWIQVGSFGSIDTAEKIKGQLSAKGYKSSIQTISANGKTFHRVKLGPYATKDDVNSILPKIKALDGMNGSFMTTK